MNFENKLKQQQITNGMNTTKQFTHTTTTTTTETEK